MTFYYKEQIRILCFKSRAMLVIIELRRSSGIKWIEYCVSLVGASSISGSFFSPCVWQKRKVDISCTYKKKKKPEFLVQRDKNFQTENCHLFFMLNFVRKNAQNLKFAPLMFTEPHGWSSPVFPAVNGLAEAEEIEHVENNTRVEIMAEIFPV